MSEDDLLLKIKEEYRMFKGWVGGMQYHRKQVGPREHDFYFTIKEEDQSNAMFAINHADRLFKLLLEKEGENK